MSDRPDMQASAVPPNGSDTDPEHTAQEQTARRQTPILRSRMLQDSGLPLAYRLNYVANRFVAALYPEITARSGLDRARFVAMLCLARVGEATAQEIAEATHRPKNSLSRAIRRLEQDGLVRRRTDPSDSRRQPMQLTKRGKLLFAELMPIAHAHERRMLEPLTAQEVEQLDGLLIKLANVGA